MKNFNKNIKLNNNIRNLIHKDNFFCSDEVYKLKVKYKNNSKNIINIVSIKNIIIK